MRLKIFRCFTLLVLTGLFFSCGGDGSETGGEPNPTKTYYIKFKADGKWKLFQVKEPGYKSCGDCACSGIPPLSSDYGSLSICNDDGEWITAAHIQSWDGSSIDFSGAGFPIASFYYSEDGVDYFSEYAADQTGSEVEITSVSSDGSFGGTYEMFKVRGTFQCKVRADGGATDIAITEGSFVVRFSEY